MGDDGISVDISREISILNNRIYGNDNVPGSAGLSMKESDTLSINDNVFYSNSRDFLVDTSHTGSSSYQMRNSLFLPPSGNLVDYTNLSINDTVPAFERPYYINWSESPGSRPSGLYEFEDKFIDIYKNIEFFLFSFLKLLWRVITGICCFTYGFLYFFYHRNK